MVEGVSECLAGASALGEPTDNLSICSAKRTNNEKATSDNCPCSHIVTNRMSVSMFLLRRT